MNNKHETMASEVSEKFHNTVIENTGKARAITDVSLACRDLAESFLDAVNKSEATDAVSKLDRSLGAFIERVSDALADGAKPGSSSKEVTRAMQKLQKAKASALKVIKHQNDMIAQLRKEELRARIVELAVAELKNDKPDDYWKDVSHSGRSLSRFWCQAFWLSMLRRAGVALDVHCETGKGAEHIMRKAGYKFPYVMRPMPGDLAFFGKLQHHALVERVDGNIATLINGNGEGGRVTRTTKLLGRVSLFYSIDDILERALSGPPPARTSANIA
jgi:hypothetical protein